MGRGDIYPIERAERSLTHFFNVGNLIALRELALRQVTQVVDRSLDAHLAKNSLRQRLMFASGLPYASVRTRLPSI